MELHFIILSALCAILLVLLILAICAFCCGACFGCGNSSYSHSRESYQHETVKNGTKTSSKGEYKNELYSNNGQILPSLMPSKQSEFDGDESQSTPLLTKYPPQPLGFGYPIETSQEEVREIPQPYRNSSSPTKRVPTSSQRTPYPETPENVETSRHVNTISFAAHQPNNENSTIITQVNVNSQHGTRPPLYYPPDQRNQRTVCEPEPYQRDTRNIETVHHVKSVSHAPYPDIEANHLSQSVVSNTHQPTKNASHSETEYSRTVMTMPANGKIAYQEDPYHVEAGSHVPQSSSQHVFSETNEVSHHYGPSKYGCYASNSQPSETVYFTRSGSCPPSDVTEYDGRNVYSADPGRNNTYSTRTVTYSNEKIPPYPISMRVANSVELLPSADMEVAYNQAQMGKSPFRKQPSQVSLYDNM